MTIAYNSNQDSAPGAPCSPEEYNPTVGDYLDQQIRELQSRQNRLAQFKMELHDRRLLGEPMETFWKLVYGQTG